MSGWRLSAFFLGVALGFICCCEDSFAQGNFRLTFTALPDESRYLYSSNSPDDIPAEMIISPGGTISSFFDMDVEFSSFAELQTDVVGQWTLFDPQGNIATFEIESINENQFPNFQIVSPVEGEQFESGTIASVVFNSLGFFRILCGSKFDHRKFRNAARNNRYTSSGCS